MKERSLNALTQAGEISQSVALVRKELEESRRRLTSSADALRTDLREGVSDLRRGVHLIKDRLNWKSWMARHPWSLLAGAFAVGIYLGTRKRE